MLHKKLHDMNEKEKHFQQKSPIFFFHTTSTNILTDLLAIIPSFWENIQGIKINIENDSGKV